jgi:hypothetical protein
LSTASASSLFAPLGLVKKCTTARQRLRKEKGEAAFSIYTLRPRRPAWCGTTSQTCASQSGHKEWKGGSMTYWSTHLMLGSDQQHDCDTSSWAQRYQVDPNSPVVSVTDSTDWRLSTRVGACIQHEWRPMWTLYVHYSRIQWPCIPRQHFSTRWIFINPSIVQHWMCSAGWCLISQVFCLSIIACSRLPQPPLSVWEPVSYLLFSSSPCISHHFQRESQ